MLAPVRHILPLTTITRDRVLPYGGRILVRKGQKVAAADVIAEGLVSSQHVILDIARGLGVNAQQADRAVQRQAGEVVEAGDIIAGPIGIARRVVRAPKAGKVVLTGNGQVLLEIQGRSFELRAGYSGLIVDLVSDRGVSIETTGALIQGTWGNGRMDSGLLTLMASRPDEVLEANRLDVSIRGAVVFGGHVNDPEVFRSAAEVPLRGLIIASMRADLIPIAAKTACPVIVIEGFGELPMNTQAFKLLSTSERREAMVIADSWNPYTGTRPEIVIGLPSANTQPPPRELAELKASQSVRVVRAPYLGSIGTVQSVFTGKSVLPNRVRAHAALVRLENGETTLIPVTNLEILE
jgi:hypothetical protein